jgi:uncharacterized membrane protein YcaP (DUF421 family)
MKVEKVILQAVLSYIILFILSKILGKKQIAQLEFSDYVIGISIGSIAAAMAVEPEIPAYHFVIAMGLFAAIDLLITKVSRKAVFLKKLLKGKPLVIIENGKINYKNLKKSNLDLNELLSQCRINGYFYIYEIEYCIFESNGELSILTNSDSRDVTAKDFKLPQEKIELSKELIIDGKIIFKAISQVNKSRKWLMDTLKIKYETELKNILLASYEDSEKTIYVYYKDDTDNKTIKTNN